MSRVSLAILVALVALGSIYVASSEAVGPCFLFKKDSGVKYSASYTTAVWTGQPTTVCLIGEPVYEVTIYVNGNNGSSGSRTALVCSILDNPITVTDSAGVAHSFAPKKGDWGDVHNGNCGKVIRWTI